MRFDRVDSLVRTFLHTTANGLSTNTSLYIGAPRNTCTCWCKSSA